VLGGLVVVPTALGGEARVELVAGDLGVGVLGTTLLRPMEFLKSLLDEYDAGIAACEEPAGKSVNNQKGVFTFVHVAESRKQAIENGAAWSALWYIHYAAIAFAVPRSVWYDQIRAGINPHLARRAAYNSRAIEGEDPTSLEITPDELPAIVLLKKLARGDSVSNEEAHEVIEHLDPPRLAAFERVLFECARPATVILTTPNVEYNVKFETLPAGKMRRVLLLEPRHETHLLEIGPRALLGFAQQSHRRRLIRGERQHHIAPDGVQILAAHRHDVPQRDRVVDVDQADRQVGIAALRDCEVPAPETRDGMAGGWVRGQLIVAASGVVEQGCGHVSSIGRSGRGVAPGIL